MSNESPLNKKTTNDEVASPTSSNRVLIKNMVCDRCIMSVQQLMSEMGIEPLSVELGIVELSNPLSLEQKERLEGGLQKLGFDLIDGRQQQTVERIKTLIIELVHYQDNQTLTNLSDYLSQNLNSEYSALSKLFSKLTGTTIERYFILQRVERIKELLFEDELSLTQIADKLNYSSVAYLSTQFKQITGMTPSQYKTSNQDTRKKLDRI